MSSAPPQVPAEVQTAIDAFAAAEVGQQLAHVEECGGRCFKASARFRSALREFGSAGVVLEFHNAEEQWFHQVAAVLEPGAELGADTIVVDWTARQFASEADAPYPRVERLEVTVQRWGQAKVIDGSNYAFLMAESENPEAGPWSEAQKRIPDRPAARTSEPPAGGATSAGG